MSIRWLLSPRGLVCLLGGLLVIIALAVGGLWYAAVSRVSNRLAAIRAEGLPTTAAEVNDFYRVPEGVTDTTTLWVDAIAQVEAASLATRGKTLPIIGPDSKPIPPVGQEWADRAAARKLLNDLEGPLLSVHRAAATSGQVRFPADFSAGINTLLPKTQGSRDVARLLLLEAHVRSHEGDSPGAAQDLLAVFELSDALRGEPSLISQLVRIALYSVGIGGLEELLPQNEWSEAELQALQQAVQSPRFDRDLLRAMQGERGLAMTALKDFPLGPLSGANAEEMLRLFDVSIAAYDRPWRENLQQQEELSHQIRTMAGNRFAKIRLAGVLLLAPPMEPAAQAGARTTARQQCAAAGLAMRRHFLKHGAWPGALADIDPQFLDARESLIDPYTGQPLRIKQDGVRRIIYSLGENQKDDGGFSDSDSSGPPLDPGFLLRQ